MQIHLAHTQGFCAGVARAIEIVNGVLKKYGPPVYIRHHIVHNTAVIKDFEKQGVVFIESIAEVPRGQRVILSAHGVSPKVYQEIEKQQLIAIDATCPLVLSVHQQALQYSKRGIQTILIGHKGHQEMIGTAGYIHPSLLFFIEKESDVDNLSLDENKPMGYLTQTTLSIHETLDIISKLKARYPKIVEPAKSSICLATQVRQDAVIELTKTCEILIICGSPNSSNSNRLKETAEKFGVKSYIIDSEAELNLDWIKNRAFIGISSGASVPHYIVESVVKKIVRHYPDAQVVHKPSKEKKLRFSLPKI